MPYAICISSGSYYLTIEKEYKLDKYDSTHFDYIVINDKGVPHVVESNLFSIEKRRHNLIDKILEYEGNDN